MATCRECGREIRDDAWACGLCGALVAAGGASQTPADPTAPADAGGLPAAGDACLQYPSPIAPASGVAVSAGAVSPARPPRLLWIVVGVGVAAVVAIVMVWFFALQGTAGGGFVGTWQDSGATRVIIGTSGSGYVLTMSDDKGKTVGPFATQMQDGNLTTRLEAAAGSSDQQQAATAMFKAVLGSIYQDFTMVFDYRAGDDTLLLSVEGVPSASGQQEVLTRVH